MNTVKWTAALPPPCCTPDTGIGVIAAGLKVAVIVQVGPASGCVRMNSHRCWPAGTVGSWSTVLQSPPVAPLSVPRDEHGQGRTREQYQCGEDRHDGKAGFREPSAQTLHDRSPLPTRGWVRPIGVARARTLSASARRCSDLAQRWPRPGQAKSDRRRGKVCAFRDDLSTRSVYARPRWVFVQTLHPAERGRAMSPAPSRIHSFRRFCTLPKPATRREWITGARLPPKREP